MQPQQLTQSRISKNARQSLALHNQGKALVRSSIVIRISASKHGAVPIPRSRPIQCHSPFASYDDANNLRTKAREPTQKNTGYVIRIRRFWFLGANVAPNERLGTAAPKIDRSKIGLVRRNQTPQSKKLRQNVAHTKPATTQLPHALIQSAP